MSRKIRYYTKVLTGYKAFNYTQTEKKINLETELTASVLKKGPKHKRLYRTLFNWIKQDKTCKISRKSSFSSYVRHKNKKNKQLIYLACVKCWEPGGRQSLVFWISLDTDWLDLPHVSCADTQESINIQSV